MLESSSLTAVRVVHCYQEVIRVVIVLSFVLTQGTNGNIYFSCPGCTDQIGFIRVKEEGWTGVFEGWQGCSKGFPRPHLMQNISFLFVKKCVRIFFKFAVLLKDPLNAKKNSKILQTVLAALQRHIGSWCMSRFYVKNLNGHIFFQSV